MAHVRHRVGKNVLRPRPTLGLQRKILTAYHAEPLESDQSAQQILTIKSKKVNICNPTSGLGLSLGSSKAFLSEYLKKSSTTGQFDNELDLPKLLI